MLGKKICCIDADMGLRNLDLVLGMENRIVYDIVDVVEGRCKPRQALIRHKHLPELHLIPAPQSRDKTAVSPSHMVQVLKDLATEFAFSVTDSPAGTQRGCPNRARPHTRVRT